MENCNRSCEVKRLIILILGILLAIAVASLFAIGLLPLFATILPYTAALGALIVLIDSLNISRSRCERCAQRCSSCFGILCLDSALVEIILSLGALAFGLPLAGWFATIYVGVLAFALWIMVLSFVAYEVCIVDKYDYNEREDD